ncbi:MAG: hypothetical protein LBT89_00190 [Planctomycetaceae bacterium]|jgi:hypothetical protein|nr:hypothetical protein [Planctomycetaceae bacterium]
MKIRDFFDYYGVIGNPFAEEDAQNDDVFKRFCLTNSFHAAWDKVYGNPAEPATSVVFGEKGSGKTALRLQMIRMLTEYNTGHQGCRPLVIDYSDLNPFIDQFKQRFPRGRKIQKVFARYEIWDHLDAILSLAVTQLVDRILEPGQMPHPAAVDTKPLPIEKLNPHQVRDLLLLSACYDTSRSENTLTRWIKLAKNLQYVRWYSPRYPLSWEWTFGVLFTFFTAYLAWHFTKTFYTLLTPWLWSIIIGSWLPGIIKDGKRFWQAWKLKRSLRVLPHHKGTLFKILLRLQKQDFTGMPFPVSGSTDHRYAMLEKLLAVCKPLGLDGLIIIMDRVDEPYLINGSAELMKLVVWSIFDNKLLKHDRVGLKLLLPDQLLTFMERESGEFHQRARLDKQNLIRSLDWTGEALFDLTNVRLRACAAEGKTPQITDFFEESLDRKRLIDAFAKLKVPRHLFKFLYVLFARHVSEHTDTEPLWNIPATTFETALSLYLRERDAAEKHLGVV